MEFLAPVRVDRIGLRSLTSLIWKKSPERDGLAKCVLFLGPRAPLPALAESQCGSESEGAGKGARGPRGMRDMQDTKRDTVSHACVSLEARSLSGVWRLRDCMRDSQAIHPDPCLAWAAWRLVNRRPQRERAGGSSPSGPL